MNRSGVIMAVEAQTGLINFVVYGTVLQHRVLKLTKAYYTCQCFGYII